MKKSSLSLPHSPYLVSGGSPVLHTMREFSARSFPPPIRLCLPVRTAIYCQVPARFCQGRFSFAVPHNCIARSFTRGTTLYIWALGEELFFVFSSLSSAFFWGEGKLNACAKVLNFLSPNPPLFASLTGFTLTSILAKLVYWFRNGKGGEGIWMRYLRKRCSISRSMNWVDAVSMNLSCASV